MLMHVGDATSTTSMDVVKRYRFCVAWKQCYAADKRQSAVDVAKKQGGRRLSGNHGGDGWNDCNEERTECQIFNFAQLLASVDIMLICILQQIVLCMPRKALKTIIVVVQNVKHFLFFYGRTKAQ